MSIIKQQHFNIRGSHTHIEYSYRMCVHVSLFVYIYIRSASFAMGHEAGQFHTMINSLMITDL